jgi:acid phosphatase family membrane protein YuiD
VNKYQILIAPFIGWILAQSIKFVLTLRKDGVTLSDAVKSGGMPSSHSAFVVALATAIAYNEGIDSIAFAITFSIACLIMYDATGVRRTTGDQTDAIDKLAKKQGIKVNVHDSRGHSVPEVLVGVAVGIVAGLLTVVIL